MCNELEDSEQALPKSDEGGGALAVDGEDLAVSSVASAQLIRKASVESDA